MAKIDELLAERKRIEAIRATPLPDLPVCRINVDFTVATIEPNGKVWVCGHYYSAPEAHSLMRFLNEWLSDTTPPPPNAATLLKAELFKELVAEMTAANDELCGAVGAAMFGSGTTLTAYQAFYARFARSLAKAKAAKA